MVFLASCVGINLGGTPWGLQHPRGVPLVVPSTFGWKTLYKLASLSGVCVLSCISEKKETNRLINLLHIGF